MAAEPVFSGHCLCGAVRFEAADQPKWAAYCHCQSCRRVTGAPVSAYAGFESAKVRWMGAAPTVYESSSGVRRGFCGRCGSTLFYEGARWPNETHLHLGIFDEPERIVPNKQAFKEEALSWFHLQV